MNKNFDEMMAAEESMKKAQMEQMALPVEDPDMQENLKHEGRRWMQAGRRAGILMLAGAMLMTQMSVSAAVKSDSIQAAQNYTYSAVSMADNSWGNISSNWGSSGSGWDGSGSNWDSSSSGSSWGSFGSNWGGNGSSWDFGSWGSWGGGSVAKPGENPEEHQVKKLPAPNMKECRYVHMTNAKNDYLLVTWDAVEGADHYEMVIQKRYGGEKSYQIQGTREHMTKGEDSWVNGCIRGSQIRVRAIDAEGVEGEWSEWKTVGCNSLAG